MRDNETLKKMIQKCMQNELKSINAIFFVCSFQEAIDMEQINSFVEFCELFKGGNNRIALLITRAETLSIQSKDQLVKQLKELQEMKDLFNKIGENIFFSGSVPKNDVERGFVESVRMKSKEVCKMRKKIFDFIFENQDCIHMDDFCFFNNYEQNTIKSIHNFLNLLPELTLNLNESKKITEFEEKLNSLKIITNLNNKISSIIKEVEPNLQFIISEENKELPNKFNNLKKEYDNLTNEFWSLLIEGEMRDLLFKKKTGEIERKKLMKKEIKLENLIESLGKEELEKIDKELLEISGIKIKNKI
jgi:hypothetical protein